jgi:hypothetical protein
MSLEQLPHELQLNVFGHLANDYTSLCGLIIVSKSLYDCALEVFRTCRILDLSTGLTDNIEAVLENLYLLAMDDTAVTPQVSFTRTSSTLCDDIVRHAFRYKILKICFEDRYGAVGDNTQPHINRGDMYKFEFMMRALAGNDSYDARTWRRKFSTRVADASLRLVLHTMRHITTLELGGSTNCLPWKIEGMLQMLRTLKLTGITNSKLSRHCCHLAAQPGLFALEISDMCITSKFIGFFREKLSITSLRFTRCWVATNALTRIIKACNKLATFEYSLKASHWEAQSVHRRQYHIGQLLNNLHPHRVTLKNLTILNLDATVMAWHCNHVGSMAKFTVLETLVVNQKHLATHRYFCRIDQADPAQINRYADVVAILSKLAPSVQTLSLHRCSETSIINMLSRVEECMGLVDLLPNLRTLEVTFAQNPSDSSTKRARQQELDLATKFKRRGIEIKFRQAPNSGR